MIREHHRGIDRELKCAGAMLSLLVALLTAAPVASAGPSSAPDPGVWPLHGMAYASAVAPDGTVYIGGSDMYVGPKTGGHALVSGSGELLAVPLGGDLAAGRQIPDGHGGCYVAASYLTTGLPRPGVLHVTADGSIDPDFSVDLGGDQPGVGLLALSPDGSTLYLGGGFQSVGGVERENLAAVRTSDGTVTPWDPPTPNNGFSALAISPDGSTVYIGGGFTAVGAVARGGLVATDATTGAVTAWDPDLEGAGGGDALVWTVALSPDGATVYVAGFFASIGGQARWRVGAIDATSAAATAWDPNVGIGGQVYALSPTPDGSTVYAAGDFDSIGGSARSGLAALDSTTGAATGWDPGLVAHAGYTASAQALCLSPDATTLYVGGWFAGTGGALRANVAAIDTETGSATSWDPNPSGSVSSLVASGSNVFLGGGFVSVGGVARHGVVAFDGITGAVKAWDPDVSGTVRALAVSPDGSTVYAGGWFTSVGGIARSNIAAIDATTGIATPWAPEADFAVLTLAADDSLVYAGGQFSTIGGEARGCIAALDAATGAATGWDPNANRWVNALVVSGSTVYAGGGFSTIADKSRMRLAALDRETGHATDWNPRCDADGGVNALAVSGSTVYVGGTFPRISGLTRRNVAAVDRATGEVTSWDSGASGDVFALAVSPDSSTVYVGGNFLAIGGATRHNLAALSAITGVAAEWNPGSDAPVYTLLAAPTVTPVSAWRLRFATAAPGDRYAGGEFTTVHGQTCGGLAVFRGGSRVPLKLVKRPSGSRYTLTRKAGVVYFTLAVTARRSDGSVVRRQPIRLQSSVDGTKWRNRFIVTTNSLGKATKRLRFTRAGGTYWRWYSPVNDWYNAASSPRTKVVVR